MMEIFIDTSAFYALADRSDAHHLRAARYFEKNCASNAFFTSEYVLVETWGLLNNKLGKPAADRFWDWVLLGAVALIGVAIEDLRGARELSKKFGDQAYSLVDCVSFRLMARFGIPNAFAFDRHFETVRVGRRSFSVVP